MRHLFIVAVIILFTACGGGSSSTGSNESQQTPDNRNVTTEVDSQYTKIVIHAPDNLIQQMKIIDNGRALIDGTSDEIERYFQINKVTLFSKANLYVISKSKNADGSVLIIYRQAFPEEIYSNFRISSKGVALFDQSSITQIGADFGDASLERVLSRKKETLLKINLTEELKKCVKQVRVPLSGGGSGNEWSFDCEFSLANGVITSVNKANALLFNNFSSLRDVQVVSNKGEKLVAIRGSVSIDEVYWDFEKEIISKKVTGCLADFLFDIGCFDWGGDHIKLETKANVRSKIDVVGVLGKLEGGISIPFAGIAIPVPGGDNCKKRCAGLAAFINIDADGEVSIGITPTMDWKLDFSLVDTKTSDKSVINFGLDRVFGLLAAEIKAGVRIFLGVDMGHGLEIVPLNIKGGYAVKGEGSIEWEQPRILPKVCGYVETNIFVEAGYAAGELSGKYLEGYTPHYRPKNEDGWCLNDRASRLEVSIPVPYEIVPNSKPAVIHGFSSSNYQKTYSWRQVAGPSVYIRNAETSSLIFDPRGLMDGAELQFEFAVKDESGKVERAIGRRAISGRRSNNESVVEIGALSSNHFEEGENVRVNVIGLGLHPGINLITTAGTCRVEKQPGSTSQMSYLCSLRAGAASFRFVDSSSAENIKSYDVQINPKTARITNFAPQPSAINKRNKFNFYHSNIRGFSVVAVGGLCDSTTIEADDRGSFYCTFTRAGSSHTKILNGNDGRVLWEGSFIVVHDDAAEDGTKPSVVPPPIPASPTPGSDPGPGPTLPGTSVSLNWAPVSGATRYDVGVRDMTTNVLMSFAPTGNSQLVTGLVPGRAYRWNVAACNTAGCSGYTTALYFAMAVSVVPPPIPASPTPGSDPGPGPTLPGTSVSLNWAPVSGATRYDVGVRDMTTNVLMSFAPTGNSQLVTGLVPGRAYRWNVAACNTAGCSGYTTALYFAMAVSVVPPPIPASPTPGSDPGPGPTLPGTSVSLNWAPVSGATRYDVGVRDMTTNVLMSFAPTGNSQLVTGLVPGRAYRWNVAACNTAGCSGYTTALYFAMAASVVPPPIPASPTPGSDPGPGPTLPGTSVSLNWAPVSGATRYDVGVRDMTTNVLMSFAPTGNSQLVTGLVPGRAYRWNVAACNTAGCSGYTTALYFAMAASVVPPPIPASPTPGSDPGPGPTLPGTSVSLNWAPVSGATRYDVGVRDMTTNVLMSFAPTGNSQLVTGLVPGRAYRWNVAACNTAGCSGYTTALYFAMAASVVPPPIPASPTPGSDPGPGPTLPGTSVSLNWAPVSGATRYDVGVRDMTTNVLMSFAPTGNSQLVTGLVPGRAYRWNVAACNTAGCSGYTTALYFAMAVSVVPPPIPASPTPGSDPGPGPTLPGTSVSLNWAPVSGATRYDVGVRDMTTNVLMSFAPTGNSQLVTGLVPGRAYRWNVAACNTAGCSGYTTALYFAMAASVVPPPIPASPTPGSDPGPGPTLPGTSVSLNWAPVSGATRYDVGVRDMTTNVLMSFAPTGNSQLVTGLVPGRAYRWNVAACNTAGCSGYTTALYFAMAVSVVPPPIPASPTPGSDPGPGPTLPGTSVSLNWAPVSGATRYDVGVRDMTTNVLMSFAPTGNSQLVTGLVPGRAYRWNVAACNTAGCSGYTTALYFAMAASVVPPPIPASPTPGSDPGPGPTLPGTSVSLNWAPVSGATRYDVGVRDMTTNVLMSFAPTGNSQLVTGLVPGRAYRWNVAACNTAGCSGYTTALYFAIRR